MQFLQIPLPSPCSLPPSLHSHKKMLMCSLKRGEREPFLRWSVSRFAVNCLLLASSGPQFCSLNSPLQLHCGAMLCTQCCSVFLLGELQPCMGKHQEWSTNKHQHRKNKKEGVRMREMRRGVCGWSQIHGCCLYLAVNLGESLMAITYSTYVKVSPLSVCVCVQPPPSLQQRRPRSIGV